jgi:hypothetical protein
MNIFAALSPQKGKNTTDSKTLVYVKGRKEAMREK